MFGMGTGGTLSLWSPGNRRTLAFPRGPNLVSLIVSALVEGLDIEYLTGSYFATCFEARRASDIVRTLASKANFMVKPNGQLVTVSSTHCCAYTPVLSNW